jgi:hypothetical protein
VEGDKGFIGCLFRASKRKDEDMPGQTISLHLDPKLRGAIDLVVKHGVLWVFTNDRSESPTLHQVLDGTLRRGLLGAAVDAEEQRDIELSDAKAYGELLQWFVANPDAMVITPGDLPPGDLRAYLYQELQVYRRLEISREKVEERFTEATKLGGELASFYAELDEFFENEAADAAEASEPMELAA